MWDAPGAGCPLQAIGEELLATIDDYDLLLSSDTNFMLGRWLEWAKDWSEVPANKAQLEYRMPARPLCRCLVACVHAQNQEQQPITKTAMFAIGLLVFVCL